MANGCGKINDILSFKLDKFCIDSECMLECKERHKENKTSNNCPIKNFIDYVSPLIEGIVHDCKCERYIGIIKLNEM